MINDKDDLYEMRFRYPVGEEVPESVWVAYWDGKAAEQGHSKAKRLYAGFLKGIPPSKNFSKNRQKALSLFESLMEDYEAGKVDREEGTFAKIEAGIMLCEGLGNKRDYERGLELIKSGEKEMLPFGGLKFTQLLKIGELYGMGYAQEDEAASNEDLKTAIKYTEHAISHFKHDIDDKQMLENAKQSLSLFIERFISRNISATGIVIIQEKNQYEIETAKERRRERELPTEKGREIENFISRLWERLDKERLPLHQSEKVFDTPVETHVEKVTPKKMFCENCGKLLKERLNFCNGCGIRLDGNRPAVTRFN